MYDIIIIGGGPAGMTAAIRAKQACSSAKILLIEKNKKLGRKLYATGNGKCNLANKSMDLSSYYSSNEFFPYEIVKTSGYMDVTEFFYDLGITVYSHGDYIYPSSLQASSVVWAMTDRLREQETETHLSEEVMSIDKKDDLYVVTTDRKKYEASVIIAAPGSAAAPKLGGSLNVYRLLGGLDVNIITPHPALCRLKCENDMKELAGVRARAGVRLLCDGQLYDSEEGEVQFTDGFLSGIAVFNMSLQCSELLAGERPLYIELELLPDMKEEDIVSYLNSFVCNNGHRNILAMLNGLLNEKLAAYIISCLNITCICAGEISPECIEEIAFTIKHLRFHITGTGTYDDSQAAFGGVDTRQLRTDTLEVYGHAGLYVAGEYADVTGKCGGYNIMWAVISGIKAGEAAGKRIIYDKNK